MNSAQRKYSVSELDILAIVEGIKFFYSYLSSSHFHVYTDRIAATHIQKMRLSTNGRITRACFCKGTISLSTTKRELKMELLIFCPEFGTHLRNLFRHQTD